MTESAIVTLDERAEQQKTEMREILEFITDNIKNLTPLHFNKEQKKELRGHIKIWRFYISHSYFEPPNEHLNEDKPPFSWLHNLLISHRSVSGLITLLAAPGVTESMDLKNGADILMLKMSRIMSYVTAKDIPRTWYLPPGDPKKTDQYGVPWKQSKSKAAKKWRKRLSDEAAERESLRLEPKPVLSEKEARERGERHLKEKNAQRKAERERRQSAREDADRRYEDEKRRLKKNGNKA